MPSSQAATCCWGHDMAEKTQPKTDIRKLHARLEKLRNDQGSYRATWQELAEIFMPRRGAHLTGGGRDTQRGKRRDTKVLNNTTIRAARTLAQGMHAGMTNPATPWFRNTLAMKTKSQRVGIFLEGLDDLQRKVFRASNVYRTLPLMYREMGIFGPSAALVRKNHRINGEYSPKLADLLHMTHLPIGTWVAATDELGRPNTLYREYYATVAQLVQEFGKDRVSTAVARLFDQGALDQFVRCVHVIEPRNVRRTVDSPFAHDMPWRSTYFEYGTNEDKLLADEGFKRFPVLIPRWDVDSDEVYGISPGWEALGDGRGMQHGELRKAQVIDYQSLPPVQMPTSLKNGAHDILPGGISYYDATGPNSGIRTAFEVNIKLPDLRADLKEVEMRVNESFYVDLFRAILDDTRSNITAREIAEKHQEKLLLLGPTVERTENEILVPLVDMCFDALVDGDEERAMLGLDPLLPDIPGEFEGGEELTFEFDSMLTQALRMTKAGNLDRFTGTATALIQVAPEAADKIDFDDIIDQYKDALGVPSSSVRDDAMVLKLRKARAEAQTRAQSAELAKTASEAERNSAQAQSLTGPAGGGQGVPTDVAPAIATANRLGTAA